MGWINEASKAILNTSRSFRGNSTWLVMVESGITDSPEIDFDELKDKNLLPGKNPAYQVAKGKAVLINSRLGITIRYNVADEDYLVIIPLDTKIEILELVKEV
jgi:hypothetical protein